MKNLKYIQLFEAFDSKVLSKTLGYIKNPKDKEIFFEAIKSMCSSIDYPLSKLSDDYFQYLPFKKALKVAAMTGDEPCEATSEEEFGRYSVDGATCQGGRIKRKWGSGIREVVCPVCHGTGVKQKKSEIKLLKFWFTSEGKYVASTVVDGLIRSRKVQKTGISYEISDYKIGKAISNVNELKGGEIVKIDIGQTTTIAYIVRDSQNRYFAIQNELSGSIPDNDDWKKIGNYSYLITKYNSNNIYLATLKEKTKEEKEEEVDPFTWNVACNLKYNGMQIQPSRDVEDLIKDAHFAIIFDFGKLKKSDFEKINITINNRKESKKGSKLDPSQSNEEIRKRNIERYIETVSRNIDISKDISNCNRLISRYLGGKKSALYVIYTTDIYSRLSNIIELYFNLMSTESETEKEYIIGRISSFSENYFKESFAISGRSSSLILEIKKRLKDDNKDERFNKILDELSEISEVIYNNLTSHKIDSIEDFEVITLKIKSIKDVLNSIRYGASRFFSNVVDNIPESNKFYRSKVYNYLIDDHYTPESTLTSLKRIKILMSKI